MECQTLGSDRSAVVVVQTVLRDVMKGEGPLVGAAYTLAAA